MTNGKPYTADDPEMRQLVELLRDHGSKAAAQRASGIAKTTFDRRVARAKQLGLLPGHEDKAVADAMDAIGTRMVPTLAWAKTEPDKETGMSYSVLLKPAAEPAPDLIERLQDAFADLRPADPVTAPEAVMSKLMTVYPLMDAHVGMHAWGRETGDGDYDLGLAEKDMRLAFAKVTALTPPSAEAVLIVGGDYLHANDNSNMTPASGHVLDVDGRHFKVLEVALRILVDTIDLLRTKHNLVTVQVLRGNHDPNSHLVMTFALAERYRNETRVSITKTPRDLFMRQWGEVAVFAHHGDKAKPERFSMMVSDICPFWSLTKHRYALTGHVHHDQAKDIGPLRWESLRAFCPPDAWSAGMGYGGRRALQALTFHTEDGLVLRVLDPIRRGA